MPVISSGMAAELRDEAWQPSLDDVLGSSSTSGLQSRGCTDSRPSTPSDTPVFSSAGSSPTKWRQWDAKKADRALEELHAARKSANAGTANFTAPVFKDIHHAVTIQNGSRIRQVGGMTMKIIAQKPNAQAPHTDMVDVKTNTMSDCDIGRPSAPKLSRESLNRKLTKLDVSNHILVNINDDQTAQAQVSANHLTLSTHCTSLLQPLSSVIPRAVPTSSELLVANSNANLIEEDLISFD
jgi:hypothetical protein